MERANYLSMRRHQGDAARDETRLAGSPWWGKNLRHLIEIGGKKAVHFGDADTAVENFAAFNLEAEKIDIAFIPYWFLLNENGRKLVRDNIAAKHNIAVHISPQNAHADAANVKRLFAEADAFTKMLEERTY